MDKREKVAKVLFLRDHPGRSWERDITAAERKEWCAKADEIIAALEEKDPAPKEKPKAKEPEPKGKPPMFGRKK